MAGYGVITQWVIPRGELQVGRGRTVVEEGVFRYFLLRETMGIETRNVRAEFKVSAQDRRDEHVRHDEAGPWCKCQTVWPMAGAHKDAVVDLANHG